MEDLFASMFGMQPIQQQPRGFMARAPQTFDRTLQALPMSFHMQKEDTRQVDSGNKVLLPPSALHQLSQMNIQYPMMFRIEKVGGRRNTKVSHCSVLEFTAPEGKVFLPLSMIHNLSLDTNGNDYVKLTNRALPKGTFARFQPFKSEFIEDIPNHKVVLEKTLRSYACLTKGDIIEIKFLDKCHDLEVVELKPSDVVSIIETDMSVEFAPPKDGKEFSAQKSKPQKPPPKVWEDSSDDEDDFGGRSAPRVLASSKSTSTTTKQGYRLKDGKSFSDAKQSNSPDKCKYKTEEEVVGNYRFIYKVNLTTGERECIRRLPNRTGPSFGGQGRSLKS